jgi:hypothetical protein
MNAHKQSGGKITITYVTMLVLGTLARRPLETKILLFRSVIDTSWIRIKENIIRVP